jgi:hypothetical protein
MQDIKIIYDSSGIDLWDNHVFNYDVACMTDAIPLYLLAEELKSLGYKVMTADVFLKSGDYGGLNFLVTEAETRYTRLLISRGCIPAICYCSESPLVIPKYYNRLITKAGKFKHSYLYRGANDSFSSGTNKKHTYFWTNAKNSINTDIPWGQRKFLTLINGNRHSAKPTSVKKISDLKTWVKIILKYCLNWKAFHSFPGDLPDLYNIRIKALLYFSRNENFHLYGQGWNDNILGLSKKEQQMIRNSYRGKFPRGNANKHEILKNYKFALCFENTIFPGYVTEKIFDCILCGAIPIYFGAPDIDEFVPRDIFIDFKKFKTFDELEQFLVSMTVEESKSYLDAAYDFVNSFSYEKYYLTSWQKDILHSLKDVIQDTNEL